MEKITKIVASLLVGVSLMACSKDNEPLQEESVMQEEWDLALVTLQPENPTHQENILLTIDESLYFDEQIESVQIRADALSTSEPLVMDPNLNQITLAVEDDVPIGEQSVQIEVTYKDGEVTEITKNIEITEDDEVTFDWDEAIIYFALTDRFYNGDQTNDYLVENTDHLETYHGGDFEGLIKKIPYLTELGVNTLWITPIVDNIEWNLREQQGDSQFGYHGYWAKDFTKIDEHLGDIETFQALLERAHDYGMKIMVDVVLNHSGYGMKPGETNPGVEHFPTPEEQQPFEAMLRTDPVPNHQVMGELAGLPDFITEDEAVRNQLIAWQTDWIEKTRTPRGDTIDFFRVDTIKHVEDTTWKAFKNKLVEIQPDFKLLGENYGASIDNPGGYLYDGEMDAVLDFDFKNLAGQFVNWDVMGVQEALIERNEQLSSDATMAQFLSSHDEDGFLYRQAGGDQGKQMVAAALQITAKGIPVVYYGEEIGLSGPAAKNMDQGEYNENRYDFDWEAIHTSGKAMHEHYQKLLNIRKTYAALFAKGDRETLTGSNQDGYLFFSRNHEGQTIIVGLTILDEEAQVSLEVPFPKGATVRDLYNGTTYTVSETGLIDVTLPKKSLGGTSILVVQE
ncbi:alpha-amylase family glycosyl hydrolase [Jeotgalibaca caeni]|uniref:alpha-amylase family glycosyl hydrolase n=1 Tax=Jeotgalibaca caeni TaxID=3028623 RepID=UPI00237DA6A0|nr:alpha-amylase family glycosyl hydrolase [Jeotgalibaca caeni]MDE1549715.1 alpha-amylase family glycosyl hydrolase [Jeotgalibaca caeni]